MDEKIVEEAAEKTHAGSQDAFDHFRRAAFEVHSRLASKMGISVPPEILKTRSRAYGLAARLQSGGELPSNYARETMRSILESRETQLVSKIKDPLAKKAGQRRANVALARIRAHLSTKLPAGNPGLIWVYRGFFLSEVAQVALLSGEISSDRRMAFSRRTRDCLSALAGHLKDVYWRRSNIRFPSIS